MSLFQKLFSFSDRIWFSARVIPSQSCMVCAQLTGPPVPAGSPPPDHDEYVAALDANLREPGRYASFRAITTSSHAESGRRLGSVDVPVTVVMGTADPDFPDAKAEAEEIAEIMGGTVVWSEGSGHYPHAETPDLVVEAIAEVVRAAR